MGKDLTHKVDFNLIRYANCWEDPELLIKAFQPLGPHQSFLSVASAGDNSFMLLLLDPKRVVAVDVNEIQLHLVELKSAAIAQFDRATVLEFLGFYPCNNRKAYFQKLCPHLSQQARVYWEQHLPAIEKGIVHTGKFEKYFQTFSKKILPLIHTKSRKLELFSNKTEHEQIDFYTKKWDNWRWRLLFRVFFSKYIMGKYGRDPQFLKEVKLTVSQYIYSKAAKHLKSKAAQTNFMLYYTLNGKFDDYLPPYLEEKNFSVIKERIGRIHLFKGYAQEAINAFGKFDGMNLSNIFEYMDDATFSHTSEELIQATNQNGRICYWNLMVPRRISEILPHQTEYQQAASEQLTQLDRGFFYNRFIIDKVYGE